MLLSYLRLITGSPSSKYEHRRSSALLRNIQNIRICMGKKPIVSVTYENERISIKNSLPYLKCVLHLSLRLSFLWVLCKRFSLHRKIFSLVRETIGFFPYKSLYFECYATMPMLAEAHISSLGYLWAHSIYMIIKSE